MDEWVPIALVQLVEPRNQHEPSRKSSHVATPQENGTANGHKKRKRSHSTEARHDSRTAPGTLQLVPTEIGGSGIGVDDDPRTLKMTEEEYDLERHKQITARRNFERVIFGKWSIRTWYFSPYPLMEGELESEPSSTPAPSSSVGPPVSSSAGAKHARAPPPSMGSRLPRASVRAHGRTSDLLASGLGRERTHGSDGKEHESVLWVCDKCFKYMTDGAVWEGHCVRSIHYLLLVRRLIVHQRKCTRRHPPGRKVYQRGAHTIWEVDGAKEKV